MHLVQLVIGAETPVLVIILHWAIALSLTCRILMKRRARGSGFAWIFITLAVPYVGAALYLMVGETWLPRRRIKRVEAMVCDDLAAEEQADSPPPEVPGIHPDLLRMMGTLAQRATGIAISLDNQIELLDGADSAFDSMIRDIENATTSCYVLTYIWHPGGRTDEVAEALIRAADRGVDCRVLADAQGSFAFFASEVHRRLVRSGIKVTSANKAGWLRLRLARIDLRNHRKIVVVDGHIGYTGSLNIVDPRFFKVRAGVGQWVDCMARLHGEAAQDLQRVFLRDWCIENPELEDAPQATQPPPPSQGDGAVAQVLPSGPAQDPKVLRKMLLTQIHSARQEIIITTPYFVPDESTMMALTSAAQSGVRVQLIVPAMIDAILVRHATRAYFQDLLAAGAEIHQYTRGLLHSKTVTADGAVGMIGTANMDLRSFELNLEVSLFVYDTGFTSKLVQLQRTYMANSQRLTPENWSRRSRAWTIVDNAAQLVAPIL